MRRMTVLEIVAVYRDAADTFRQIQRDLRAALARIRK